MQIFSTVVVLYAVQYEIGVNVKRFMVLLHDKFFT